MACGTRGEHFDEPVVRRHGRRLEAVNASVKIGELEIQRG